MVVIIFMNIHPICLYNLNNYTNIKKTQNNTPIMLNRISAVDTVSFGSAENGKDLKKLLDYDIPDMYTGQIMISPSVYEKMRNNGTFTSPISHFYRAVAPYQKSLLPVEAEIFDYIEKESKISPNKNLKDVIIDILPEHKEKYRQIMTPVFDDLKNMAQNMPKKTRRKYLRYIAKTLLEYNKEPETISFNRSKFLIELQKNYDEIKNSDNRGKVRSMKKIIDMTKTYTDKVENNPFKHHENLSSKERHHIMKNLREDKQKEFINKIEKIVLNSPLKDDIEVVKLVSDTKLEMLGLPKKSPFNRTKFISGLKNITEQIEDRELAQKIIQRAYELPTARENISAFVMKAMDEPNEKIGKDILSGSIGSIEHILPASDNGEDNICNYGLASSSVNSKRSNLSFSEQLKRYPQAYENCQKYIDRIIDLINDGTCDDLDIDASYVAGFARNVYNLSPEEKRLNLDISRLQIYPQD